jgi:hypothetical protein
MTMLGGKRLNEVAEPPRDIPRTRAQHALLYGPNRRLCRDARNSCRI